MLGETITSKVEGFKSRVRQVRHDRGLMHAALQVQDPLVQEEIRSSTAYREAAKRLLEIEKRVYPYKHVITNPEILAGKTLAGARVTGEYTLKTLSFSMQGIGGVVSFLGKELENATDKHLSQK